MEKGSETVGRYSHLSLSRKGWVVWDRRCRCLHAARVGNFKAHARFYVGTMEAANGGGAAARADKGAGTVSIGAV